MIASSPRRIELLADLAHAGERRHRALARLAGARDRARWRRSGETERETILIGLIEHAGDIVAAEPIARRLRREHPEARIVWATRPAYRPLAEAFEGVDATAPIRCLGHWLALRDGAGLPDRTLDLHLPGRDCPLCRRRRPWPTDPDALSLRTYYRDGPLLHAFCRLAGLPPLDEAPRLSTPPSARRTVDRLALPPRFVCVHCTSNQEARDWTAAKWHELAARVRRRLRLPVVEVGTRPVLRAGPGVIDLCGRLPLLASAEVIRRAALFVGIDSGPAHLASAVSTPGVVLLGKYRAFDRYTPYTGHYADGSLATLIHHPAPVRELPVGTAFEAIAARLKEEHKDAAPSQTKQLTAEQPRTPTA